MLAWNRFRLCVDPTITKTFTAALILKLCEDGRLGLRKIPAAER